MHVVCHGFNSKAQPTMNADVCDDDEGYWSRRLAKTLCRWTTAHENSQKTKTQEFQQVELHVGRVTRRTRSP